MRRSRFAEEQIIAVLKEAEAGQTVKDLRRKHGIREQTFCRWKTKYGGKKVNEARRQRGDAMSPLPRGAWESCDRSAFGGDESRAMRSRADESIVACRVRVARVHERATRQAGSIKSQRLP